MTQVLLFTKKDDASRQAIEMARVMFGDRLTVISGKVGDAFPEDLGWMEIDAIISFLSPWIIPQWLLDKAKIAINFHPGSRYYPGIGCYNFALYDGTPNYGAVCHQMDSKVDTGYVISERTFPVFASDSVESLKSRTMTVVLAMFSDVAGRIAAGMNFEPCYLRWARKPYTRKELDALCVVTADMSSFEVARRVRACAYAGYQGAYVEVGGVRFNA